MMNNYPPGVTGNEFQISGPEREWEERRFCDRCGRITWHAGMSHRDVGAWLICSDCNTETDITGEDGCNCGECSHLHDD